jgi:hypothetical protein
MSSSEPRATQPSPSLDSGRPFLRVRRFALCLGLAVVACSHPAADSTPEGAFRAWLDHMEATREDPKEAKEAFLLLGPSARANLAERAARASQTEGQRIEPFELLAPGFLGLQFLPRPQSIQATVVGDRATLEVKGEREVEHASIVCVREAGGWRVEPELPALPAPSLRPDAGF